MKIVLLIYLYSTLVFSKEFSYQGVVSFKADTNIPHVALEAVANEFDRFTVLYNKDLSAVLKIEIIIDFSKFTAGLVLENYRVFQQDLSYLLHEKPAIYLTMSMSDAFCVKQKQKLNCTGTANFMVEKAGFRKIINFIIDQDLNTNIDFNISQKESSLTKVKTFGIGLKDLIWVSMKAFKPLPKERKK